MTASSERGTLPIRRTRVCTIVRRGVLALLVSFTVLGIAGWFGRELLLRSAAELWIISDQAAPADAVAVFGGGLEVRPFAAADYYRQGLVGKILLSNIGASRVERLGVRESHVEANRKVLLKLGVPETAIESFGSELSNTSEEARALRDWAVRTGARSIIVPTEIFSARRVRWMLHRVFPDGVIVRVPALDPLDYHRDDWWKHEGGLIGFQNEVIKYVYYRFKY
jgi:uncharacterized SAM-binding protein YcdF (DUF218 family)